MQVAADIGHFLLERQFAAQLAETAAAKGVAEAPLREVLKRLGETEVAEAEIPDRLAKAADELIRLRADLERLRNDRPEFAVIRARASALIDKGDFDAARAALNEGRERARALREEASRTEAGFLADEARVDRLQLNYDAACAKFAEAAQLDPDNVWLWIELGDLWETRGSLAEATKAFSAARDAAARSGHDRDLAASSDRLGDVQVEQGDLAGALKSYHVRLSDRRAAWRNPIPATSKLTARSFGPVPENWRRAGRAGRPRRCAEVLSRQPRDPRPTGAIRSGNAGWQRRSLAVVRADRRRAGRAGRPRRGIDLLSRQSRDQRPPGASPIPTMPAGSAISLFRTRRLATCRLAQGDPAGALTSYRDSLAIFDRLAKSDPGNAGWQRDLSVSYNERIGDVQVAQGDLAGALKSYRDSLAIADRLAKSDPGNAGWQRDLSVSYNKIGDVQVAQGDLAGALKSYRDSLAIIEPAGAIRSRQRRLAARSLGVLRQDRRRAGRAGRPRRRAEVLSRQPRDHETDWRNPIPATPAGSAISRCRTRKIASVLRKMGNGAEALEALRRGHAIMVRLTALSPDNVQWKQDLDWFASQIAELSQ